MFHVTQLTRWWLIQNKQAGIRQPNYHEPAVREEGIPP